MKKFVVVFCAFWSFGLLSMSPAFAQNANEGQLVSKTVRWLSWEEAIELSKEDPRKIVIDVYTEWCGWCKKMDKTTFAKKLHNITHVELVHLDQLFFKES